MPGFTGRLFGPGFAGTGVTASGRWLGGRLELHADGRRLLVEAQPTLDARGFNAAQLRVSWGEPEAEFAFFVDAGKSRDAFSVGLPAELASVLRLAENKQSSVERNFRSSWLALVLFLALPLLSLPVFVARSDSLSAWVVERIPPEQEARLGDLVLAQTRAQMRLLDQGPAVDALRTIGGKLTPGTRHQYRWFVAERPEVNAFAAPGGVVVVFRGLIDKAGRPEELAGVLAHEVAHAELRHGLQGMLKSLGLRALVATVAGDWSGSVVVDAATSLTEMSFSRDAERAADSDGLKRLVAARVDPNGMVEFFATLAKQEGGAAVPAILSTHPATTERLASLKQEVAALRGDWQPLAVDWAAARAAATPPR